MECAYSNGGWIKNIAYFEYSAPGPQGNLKVK